jgi:hypothetical protein
MNQEYPLRFYSRFSLSGSQPYVLTPAFEQGSFSHIPGTTWVPDFSMWQVNNPDFPSGPSKCSNKKSLRCKRFVDNNGYVFWKTRDFYN